jgi:hypothetical protein
MENAIASLKPTTATVRLQLSQDQNLLQMRGSSIKLERFSYLCSLGAAG